MAHYDSFIEALGVIDTTPHLLCGNGLSRDFDNGKFSYEKLFDAAGFQADNPKIDRVFKTLDTKDFETVAGSLIKTRQVAQSFGYSDFVDELSVSIDSLKTSLINAVSENHPPTRDCISDENAENFHAFISVFLDQNGLVFSLNYDALIYWAVLRKTKKSKINNYADGFGFHNEKDVIFLGDACQRMPNILFPHGTLYIRELNGEIYKPKAMNNEEALITIIRRKMDGNNFPLFVSEGNSYQKLEAIRRSFYLNYCFEKIKTRTGRFFIIGHSLDLESDGHIISAVLGNKNITDVYISCFDVEKVDEITAKMTMLKIKLKNKKLNIHTFPADSIHAWR